MRRLRIALALLPLSVLPLLAGCGGGSGAPASPGAGSATDFPPYSPTPLACAGGRAVAPFDGDLVIGYSGDLAQVGAKGFGLRYQYLAGPLATDPACLSAGRAKAEGCNAPPPA